MIKVAVIGVGSMGQNHARVYFNNEDTELVAVADPNEVFLQQACKRYHAKGYADYREMLEKENIDAVSIAVPTKFHKDVAVFALNKGKHVLLEKPIASTEKEAREIIDCANRNKVKLMIGHIERFNPAIIELKKRLHELGEIYKIDVQRIGPFPSRITDVGVIVDLSVHDLDVIGHILGSKPSRVYAETQKRLHPHHEDSVTALLRYENDILAVLNVNYLSPTKMRQLRVFGKKGMFLVNYLNQELFFYENNSYSSDDWSSVTEGDIKKIRILKREPLASEVDAFLSCIMNKTSSPASGEEGLEVLRIAVALSDSAASRSTLYF